MNSTSDETVIKIMITKIHEINHVRKGIFLNTLTVKVMVAFLKIVP